MSTKECENFPVDIVYLWCDSSDKNWQEKKKKEFLNAGKIYDEDAVSDCRFINSNELKYSLRSVEKFAPWIRNIIIVTDNQIPDWLDVSNPKIRIVNHSDILPEMALPTFNASAIETSLHKIPDLSEHFLFANDDMFFGNHVDKSFFFSDDGMPVFRFSKRKIINKKYKHLYGYMVSKAYNSVRDQIGQSFPYFPHHNIDAYCKSDIAACYEDFKEEFEATVLQKFREKDCLQRSVFSYHAAALHKGTCKIVNEFPARLNAFITKQPLDSILIELKKSKLSRLNNMPYLFCLNDSLKTTDEDRGVMLNFLQKMFPEQASFEKKYEMNTKIYICYHKDFQKIENEVLTPIQVGAALSDIDLGFEKDSSGESISYKNKYYSELTALYWIWKNSKADYAGLMHYRRLFDLADGSKRWYNSFLEDIDEVLNLNKNTIENILSDFDIILPMKRVIPKVQSSYQYYKKKHIISDLDAVLEIIKDYSPEIYSTAEEVLKHSNSMYLYNMFIASKEFLDEYAQWLFEILSRLEVQIQTDIEVRTPYQQRVYGFLSERLFTIYIEYRKKSGLKVKEVPVVYCETKKSRYDAFQLRTSIYKVLCKLGIRKLHWKEQYGV